MGKIEVNPAVLERTAARMSGTAEELQVIAGKFEEVKGNVEAGWRSRYTSEYTSELNVLKNNMSKLSSQTQMLSGKIKRMAEQIRRVEEENKAMFGNR